MSLADLVSKFSVGSKLLVSSLALAFAAYSCSGKEAGFDCFSDDQCETNKEICLEGECIEMTGCYYEENCPDLDRVCYKEPGEIFGSCVPIDSVDVVAGEEEDYKVETNQEDTISNQDITVEENCVLGELEGKLCVEKLFETDYYSYGITYHGKSLWISDLEDYKIYKISLDGDIEDTIDVQHKVKTMTWQGDNLWYLSENVDEKLTYAYKVNQEGDVLSSFPLPKDNCWGIVSVEDHLWVSGKDMRFYKMDEEGELLDEVHYVSGYMGLGWDEEKIWVAAQRKVWELIPEAEEPFNQGNKFSLDQFFGNEQYIFDLAYDGETLIGVVGTAPEGDKVDVYRFVISN
jgi:hypothetical protein